MEDVQGCEEDFVDADPDRSRKGAYVVRHSGFTEEELERCYSERREARFPGWMEEACDIFEKTNMFETCCPPPLAPPLSPLKHRSPEDYITKKEGFVSYGEDPYDGFKEGNIFEPSFETPTTSFLDYKNRGTCNKTKREETDSDPGMILDDTSKSALEEIRSAKRRKYHNLSSVPRSSKKPEENDMQEETERTAIVRVQDIEEAEIPIVFPHSVFIK